MDTIDRLKEERSDNSSFPSSCPERNPLTSGMTPLQTSGVLDSMAILQLAKYVQTHYGIDLEAYDAGMEFDSIDTIASFIQSKGGHAS